MTASSEIDVRDLRSVRKVAGKSEVVLGDEYVSPDTTMDLELVQRRQKRGIFSIKRSPLARKIVTFNLLAILIIVCGVLFLMPSRDNLSYQRASGMVNEVELIADVFEAQMPVGAPVNLMTSDGINVVDTLSGLDLRSGVDVFIFDPSSTFVAGRKASSDKQVVGLEQDSGKTFITDLLRISWEGFAKVFARDSTVDAVPISMNQARLVVPDTLQVGTNVSSKFDEMGNQVFRVATPLKQGDRIVGVVVMLSEAGELDGYANQEREQILQLFVIGVLVSIIMSFILASTIANPLSDLAAAAEFGRDKNARKMSPTRVRIPDLTARPDEIGRLSGAMRGMVSALYERIESNEQFAADVAHEIKNPLASLRSAVGTMRVAKRDDQRERLLEVIEHDVQRLDRLVSDISNASRLDSELVKEDQQEFDLINMLSNIAEYLGQQAEEKGVDFLTNFPNEPLIVSGLEGRLAQVFVNLIGNATSFCEEGDAIRLWVRRRENRVLVVVEDTGPGIPEEALTKIFKRFYSERPEGQFGNNSGLGLAISKQIVEAHGGVIWAENIRPTEADLTSDPLGARFVVGLPV